MEVSTHWAGRGTRWREQSGMTLIEMMLAMILTLIIGGAALTILTSLQRQAAADIERATAIQDGEAGLLRMTRELREAYAVSVTSGDEMRVTLRRDGAALDVRYNCAQPHPTLAGLYRCVRFATEGGVARTDVVVDRVINAAPATAAADRVFQYPNGRPSFVRAQIEVPARGEKPRAGFTHTVVLDDGFYMRNCDVSC
jgi:prepilin-type N-terminal cleavage/methylation domain-containing protein